MKMNLEIVDGYWGKAIQSSRGGDYTMFDFIGVIEKGSHFLMATLY